MDRAGKSLRRGREWDVSGPGPVTKEESGIVVHRVSVGRVRSPPNPGWTLYTDDLSRVKCIREPCLRSTIVEKPGSIGRWWDRHGCVCVVFQYLLTLSFNDVRLQKRMTV